jgi:hypothetical protein
VATIFLHRDSRDGDSYLHTHVATSNRVRSRPEQGGHWLALDGRKLFKFKRRFRAVHHSIWGRGRRKAQGQVCRTRHGARKRLVPAIDGEAVLLAKYCVCSSYKCSTAVASAP